MFLRMFLCLLAVAMVSPLAAQTNTPFARLTLRDQFDRQHWFEAASNAVTVITVADRDGAAQVDAWVRAIKARYAGQVTQLGVASLAGVPGPMRGMVRKKFAAQYPNQPVLLDWRGDVSRHFTPAKNAANLLVVSRGGALLKVITGPASEDALTTLDQVVQPLLATTPTESQAARMMPRTEDSLR